MWLSGSSFQQRIPFDAENLQPYAAARAQKFIWPDMPDPVREARHCLVASRLGVDPLRVGIRQPFEDFHFAPVKPLPFACASRAARSTPSALAEPAILRSMPPRTV